MADASLRVSAPTLAVVDGHPTTTSIDVARHFGKQHRDVLRAIEGLIAQLPAEHLRNFAQVSYEVDQTNGGKASYPMYRLTRDGFTLLAMGFTGKKALAFKLAYIDAFNRMEAELKALPIAHPSIDVRTRLLGGQSSPPPEGYPRQVESAIERAAWKMARETYELASEHLRRRVAYRWVWDPQNTRQLNVTGALAEIRQTTLGQCLVREAVNQVERAQYAVTQAVSVTQRAQTELAHQMDQLTSFTNSPSK